ncbi:kinase suppressor of Ras 2-like isoform X1 [Petromyzon marinus]|uniref:Kinase suppressor of Ras 2-like isoform X1 n=2 Tax=Petromyzon marinus TaxID=7757 RepID=A0AAJ7X717_PETMA|nr:kinase suppressor of Ras 2-like isoform X1 [Petromyzon marinus]
MAQVGSAKQAADKCEQLQCMIDISLASLEGLRTKCASSSDLARHEIETLEGKLVCYFSQQLTYASRVPREERRSGPQGYPRLGHWLRLVGLQLPMAQGGAGAVGGATVVASLEVLLAMSDAEVSDAMAAMGAEYEGCARLNAALACLRLVQSYTDGEVPADEVVIRWPDEGDAESPMGIAVTPPPPSPSPPSRSRHVHSNGTMPLSPESCDAVRMLGLAKAAGDAAKGSRSLPSSPDLGRRGIGNAGAAGAATRRGPRPSTGGASSGNVGGVNAGTSSTSMVGSISGSNNPKVQSAVTPPASRRAALPAATSKHQRRLGSGSGSGLGLGALALLPSLPTISRSKSHESQLHNRVDEPPVTPKSPKKRPPLLNLLLGGSAVSCESLPQQQQQRSPLSGGHRASDPALATASPPGAHIHPSPSSADSLGVPRWSPQNHRRDLVNSIKHRFTTKTWWRSEVCSVCERGIMFGVRCKNCQLQCHNKCMKNAPSCQILIFPPNTLAYEHNSLPARIKASGNGVDPGGGETPPPSGTGLSGTRTINFPSRVKERAPIPYQQPVAGGSAASSCASSPPSSAGSCTPSSTPCNSPRTGPASSSFSFPDIPSGADNTASSDFSVALSPNPQTGGGGSGDGVSPRTPTADEGDSSEKLHGGLSASEGVEEEQPVVEVATSPKPGDMPDSAESSETVGELSYVARGGRTQTSILLKEWNIPFERVELGELIGRGRFGAVHRGRWYGEVAVRLVTVEGHEQQRLRLFKQEVLTYRQTRHENVVLFMGACMNPPHLAIVTSFCKGRTLYAVVRDPKVPLDINKTNQIAREILKGMGYLHHKGIVHKDLKSKNVFYDNGKVIITDFGLFSISGVVQDGRSHQELKLPRGWLCYLAPEIIRQLAPGTDQDLLPFSNNTDVFAFGTIWYELHCREWPYKQQPAESIIWQGGRGLKPHLDSTGMGREALEILTSCWAFETIARPTFPQLMGQIEKLPKLNRRHSQPGGNFWRAGEEMRC